MHMQWASDNPESFYVNCSWAIRGYSTGIDAKCKSIGGRGCPYEFYNVTTAFDELVNEHSIPHTKDGLDAILCHTNDKIRAINILEVTFKFFKTVDEDSVANVLGMNLRLRNLPG